jgi:hypothetical protein
MQLGNLATFTCSVKVILLFEYSNTHKQSQKQEHHRDCFQNRMDTRKRHPLVKILLVWVVCQLQVVTLFAFQIRAVSIGRQALCHNNKHNTSNGNTNRVASFYQLGTRRASNTIKTRQDASVVQQAAVPKVEREGTKTTTPSNIRTQLRWPLMGATILLLARLIAGESLRIAYTNLMTRYPLPTKMATGALLAAVGDALAQSRDTKASYNSLRAASFM